MKAIIRALSFAILWFTCNSSGLCLQNVTPPGSIGDGPTSTSRSLDDIRSELKKKNVEVGGMGMGSSGMGMGMMGNGGSMGMGSMMGGPGMGAGMGASGGMGGGEMGGMGMAAPTEKQLLAQLIQQLRGRLGSKKFKRDKVEKQLRTALQQYFDADIEERVKEFDKVKARVIVMEAKLQRRLDSESEIVDLQLKQMLHKADGLDFNVPSGSDGGMAPGMGGYGDMGSDAGSGDMMGGSGYPGAGMGGMGMGPGMGYGDMGDGMGDMGGMGMGPGGMAMGGGYGAEMGVDLTVLGYDASFGLTRLQRLDPTELDDSDPLRSYAQVNKLAEGAKTADSDSEKMTALLSAFHLFEARFHHFPRSANRQTKSQPPHSWRVAILPLIGHGDLYKEYQFDQPWDSQQNLEVAKKMPELYRTSAKENSTSFMMIVDGGSFDSSKTPARMMDILDGTSNTIALILSDKEVAWAKPYADVIYSENSPVPGLSKSRLVGMVDGTTRTLLKIEDSVFRALITRAGGEVVSVDEGAK